MQRLLSIIISALLPSSLMAGNITVERPLHFGKIAIQNNNQVYDYHIFSNGNIINDAGFVIIQDGQPGQYFLYNFPPSSLLNIQLSDTVMNAEYAGSTPSNTFTLHPYLDHDTYYTNQHGELTLKMGARLKTSGSGQVYNDGDYYKSFEIIVNY